MANHESFPIKLWKITHTCTTGAISWAPDGKSILINFPYFEREFLHNCYSQKSFNNMNDSITFNTKQISSFIRQLNLYGFRKSSKLRQKLASNMEHNDAILEVKPKPFGNNKFDEDSDIHEYFNPYFIRNQPELLKLVKRSYVTTLGVDDKENKAPKRSIFTTEQCAKKKVASMYNELEKLAREPSQQQNDTKSLDSSTIYTDTRLWLNNNGQVCDGQNEWPTPPCNVVKTANGIYKCPEFMPQWQQAVVPTTVNEAYHYSTNGNYNIFNPSIECPASQKHDLKSEVTSVGDQTYTNLQNVITTGYTTSTLNSYPSCSNYIRQEIYYPMINININLEPKEKPWITNRMSSLLEEIKTINYPSLYNYTYTSGIQADLVPNDPYKAATSHVKRDEPGCNNNVIPNSNWISCGDENLNTCIGPYL